MQVPKDSKPKKPRKAKEPVLKRVPEEDMPEQAKAIAAQYGTAEQMVLAEASTYTGEVGPGMNNEQVRLIQEILGVQEEGYGALTKRAVMSYQAGNEYIGKMDGFVGAETWQQLFALKLKRASTNDN